MKLNTEVLSLLDELFLEMDTASIEVEEFNERLSSLLCQLLDRGEESENEQINKYDFKVIYNDDRLRPPFFGFRIFPSEEYLKMLARYFEIGANIESIVNSWNTIPTWVIEVDSRLFSYESRLTNREITSLLLLILGYTTYSTITIEDIVIQYNRIASQMLNTFDKGALDRLSPLLAMPIALACMKRIPLAKDGMVSIKTNIFDNIDYKLDLESAYNKIIKTFGYNTMDRTEANVRTILCFIKDFVKRKTELVDYFYAWANTDDSIFIANLAKYVLSDLKYRLRDKYSSNLVNSNGEITLECLQDPYFKEKYALEANREYLGFIETGINGFKNNKTDEIALEAFKKSSSKHKLPAQYEIDVISVEIDRMENQRDRIYVLSLIYNIINKINEFTDQYEFNPQLENRYSKISDSMLKELENLRQRCLGKRNFDYEYKFFVKYPKGYEG